ncbi:hypothetical protein WPS_21060 [Vulcanimicrobium alpinum]|uniref:Uncharacterized protein n=1 Tax=Vulcanimicrobium alpinum TaxID=3016050 RepID=A0AAN1XWS7_UNVUL|nr:hypothetical protein [Vulcanimicrobium alpinum]BDE06830.1 hypothetical protein WPS_21060 [Vulcanimicrobium alpinum]
MQTQFRALALALALIPAGAVAAETPAAIESPAPATVTVLVPRGVPIVVRTLEGHNSYSAQTGQHWHFELVNDVIVDGYVVARAGDDAEGGVAEAQQGRDDLFVYRGANLRVGVDEVHSFCGDTLAVRFDRSEYRRRQGFFGSNKDVTVVRGQMYVPLTSRAQRVCGVPTTATPAPIPAGAIRTADH